MQTQQKLEKVLASDSRATTHLRNKVSALRCRLAVEQGMKNKKMVMVLNKAWEAANAEHVSPAKPIPECMLKIMQRSVTGVLARMEAELFRMTQRGNYESGWCSGDVDWY